MRRRAVPFPDGPCLREPGDAVTHSVSPAQFIFHYYCLPLCGGRRLIVSFKELNLDSNLLKAIEQSGFTAPTEIQREAIPVVLAGRDLMASAQTGTGKTAAFVLPALQKLMTPAKTPGIGPRVLVLTPTRELAQQINESISQFGRHCRMTMGNVVGGMPYPPQTRLLRQPLDLLVATPGRLMDHMEQGRVDFSRLEILVLDEADRMLDMGFVDAVKIIAAATPANRQTLLFSATLEGRVLAIAKALLKDPVRVQLAANHDQHASIEQRVYHADNISHKHRLLTHYLSKDDLTQAVIFPSTTRGADRLAQVLTEQGHTSAALHGATGTAVALIGPDDWGKLAGIERLTGNKLDRQIVPGLEPSTPEPRSGGQRRPGGFKPKGNSGYGARPRSSQAPRPAYGARQSEGPRAGAPRRSPAPNSARRDQP